MILRLALPRAWVNRNLDVRGSCYRWSKTTRNAGKILLEWKLFSIIYLFFFVFVCFFFLLTFTPLEGFLE